MLSAAVASNGSTCLMGASWASVLVLVCYVSQACSALTVLASRLQKQYVQEQFGQFLNCAAT
jgi:hypothetical protein